MTQPASKWEDLAPRLGAGLAMVLVGLACVWLGGYWFHALIGIVCGVMVWELVCMFDGPRAPHARSLGALAGAAVLIAIELPAAFALPLLLAPALVGMGQLRNGGATFGVFTAMILLAGYGMMALRDDFGMVWMLWLVLVVVVTDVAGYFAGRMFGGPKLWPRVSPKKTWSGSAAGWLGAALVGLAFATATKAGIGLAGISVAVSMASQIGDIGESAIKRRVGVKDSSSLIPGHGGLLDRFDGMLGASIFIVIVGQMIGFPPGTS